MRLNNIGGDRDSVLNDVAPVMERFAGLANAIERPGITRGQYRADGKEQPGGVGIRQEENRDRDRHQQEAEESPHHQVAAAHVTRRVHGIQVGDEPLID